MSPIGFRTELQSREPLPAPLASAYLSSNPRLFRGANSRSAACAAYRGRFGCLVDSILRGAFADLFTTPALPPVPSLPLRLRGAFHQGTQAGRPRRGRPLRVGAPLTLFRPLIKGLPGLVTGRIGGLMHRGVHLHPAKVGSVWIVLCENELLGCRPIWKSGVGQREPSLSITCTVFYRAVGSVILISHLPFEVIRVRRESRAFARATRRPAFT